MVGRSRELEGLAIYVTACDVMLQANVLVLAAGSAAQLGTYLQGRGLRLRVPTAGGGSSAGWAVNAKVVLLGAHFNVSSDNSPECLSMTGSCSSKTGKEGSRLTVRHLAENGRW